MRSADARSCIPLKSKPAQIFFDRVAELRTAARGIEIFNSQHERAIAFATPLLRAPERNRMPDVQVTCW